MARKALVVEDDPTIGLLLSQNLQRWGFEPTVFEVGRPVADWVRQQQPELVLLDLMLPDMDGYDICQELKLDRQTNLIPLVMVTARVQPQEKARGLEVGANYYLTKPFRDEELHHAITEALAWRQDLQRCGGKGEVHFRMRSTSRHLEEVNDLLSSLFLFTPLTEGQIRHLTMAVRELGRNAIEWGHRRQEDRLVTVRYNIDAEKIVIVIQDTGPGFDPEHLPHAADTSDPAAHLLVREALGLRDGGFGILMARGLVDQLQYNETGNEVRLVKYFARAENPVEAAARSLGRAVGQGRPGP